MTNQKRFYLCCPYSEKDEAKALGEDTATEAGESQVDGGASDAGGLPHAAAADGVQ